MRNGPRGKSYNTKYMKLINVRKLTALDMTFNNRWIILTEFVVGSLGAFALAYLLTLGVVWSIVLVGIGVNYAPLALYAIGFVYRGDNKEVAASIIHQGQTRRYNIQQAMVLVPFLLAVISVVQFCLSLWKKK